MYFRQLILRIDVGWIREMFYSQPFHDFNHSNLSGKTKNKGSTLLEINLKININIKNARRFINLHLYP